MHCMVSLTAANSWIPYHWNTTGTLIKSHVRLKHCTRLQGLRRWFVIQNELTHGGPRSYVYPSTRLIWYMRAVSPDPY